MPTEPDLDPTPFVLSHPGPRTESHAPRRSSQRSLEASRRAATTAPDSNSESAHPIAKRRSLPEREAPAIREKELHVVSVFRVAQSGVADAPSLSELSTARYS